MQFNNQRNSSMPSLEDCSEPFGLDNSDRMSSPPSPPPSPSPQPPDDNDDDNDNYNGGGKIRGMRYHLPIPKGAKPGKNLSSLNADAGSLIKEDPVEKQKARWTEESSSPSVIKHKVSSKRREREKRGERGPRGGGGGTKSNGVMIPSRPCRQESVDFDDDGGGDNIILPGPPNKPIRQTTLDINNNNNNNNNNLPSRPPNKPIRQTTITEENDDDNNNNFPRRPPSKPIRQTTLIEENDDDDNNDDEKESESESESIPGPPIQPMRQITLDHPLTKISTRQTSGGLGNMSLKPPSRKNY